MKTQSSWKSLSCGTSELPVLPVNVMLTVLMCRCVGTQSKGLFQSNVHFPMLMGILIWCNHLNESLLVYFTQAEKLSEWQEPPSFELFHHCCLFRERHASLKPCQADKETKQTTTIQICSVEGLQQKLALIRGGSGGDPLCHTASHLFTRNWLSSCRLSQAFCKRSILLQWSDCLEFIVACLRIKWNFNQGSVTDEHLWLWPCDYIHEYIEFSVFRCIESTADSLPRHLYRDIGILNMLKNQTHMLCPTYKYLQLGK